MADDKPKALDVLGIGPLAESVRKVTDATVDGAAAVLSRICLPAAEEFGLLLRDRVRHYRALNIAKLTAKTEEKLKALNVPSAWHAHPRVVSKIIEEGSWTEDEGIQEMWAGLLAASCSPDGQDDSNLIFIHLLSRLSHVQAKLLNYACEKAEKKIAANGLLFADELIVKLDDLRVITGEQDVHRLDREMDYLRSLELILGGFGMHMASTDALITPTAIALHMYARCKGFRGSPIEFFGLESATPQAP